MQFVLRHYVELHPFDLEVNDLESCNNEQCFLPTMCYD